MRTDIIRTRYAYHHTSTNQWQEAGNSLANARRNRPSTWTLMEYDIMLGWKPTPVVKYYNTQKRMEATGGRL